MRQLYVALFAAFPDFHIDIAFLKHGDDHVLVEARWPQQEEWAGIPSMGCSFNGCVAFLFEFEVDQLVCPTLGCVTMRRSQGLGRSVPDASRNCPSPLLELDRHRRIVMQVRQHAQGRSRPARRAYRHPRAATWAGPLAAGAGGRCCTSQLYGMKR